jgi:undecaprenyl-diphosphatase
MISWSIFLGAVQGLTEFLPISSSAHLVILPWLFHRPDPGLAFDVALHFGTALAVIIYFRRKIWRLLRALVRTFYSRRIDQPEERLVWMIIVASVPAAFFGYLLELKAETIFRAPLLIALTLSIFGLILYLVDRYRPAKRNLGKMHFPESFGIGLAQVLAIIPGVSRSGATISAARLMKFSRREAAKFSFLLAAPVLIGAFAFKFKDLLGSQNHQLGLDSILGALTAFIFGYLAIGFLMKYLVKGSFLPFVIYRIILAVVVVVVYLMR